jgi:hypothetical protein
MSLAEVIGNGSAIDDAPSSDSPSATMKPPPIE